MRAGNRRRGRVLVIVGAAADRLGCLMHLRFVSLFDSFSLLTSRHPPSVASSLGASGAWCCSSPLHTSGPHFRCSLSASWAGWAPYAASSVAASCLSG